jgi:hypothetical protein
VSAKSVTQFTEQDGRRLAERLGDGESVIVVVEARVRPSWSHLRRRLAIAAGLTALGSLLVAVAAPAAESFVYVWLAIPPFLVALVKPAGPVRLVALTSRRVVLLKPAWTEFEVAVAHAEVPAPGLHGGGESQPSLRLQLRDLTVDVTRPYDLHGAVAFDEFVAHCAQRLPSAP